MSKRTTKRGTDESSDQTMWIKYDSRPLRKTLLLSASTEKMIKSHIHNTALETSGVNC